jgi:CubicO group peptidase (beta-lactamase class C family)
MMTARLLLAPAVCTLLLLTGPARAEGADMQAKARQVDGLFECVAGADAPGAAVLVARNGEVLLAKGYGFANIEHRVPNTPHTKFRLASVTKSITAAAILQLQDAGKLSLDDQVARYLPDMPHASEITIRQLLTHASGLRSSEKDPLEFTPGERMNYSNTGYQVLGRIIEKVTGQSYEDYLRAAIFEPLGMQGSGMDHYAPIVANRASGYDRDGGAGYVNAPPGDMAGAFSAGGLYSTVEDLYRFDQALLTGALLKPETAAAAFTPGRLNDGTATSYGFGWMLANHRGLRETGHGGDGTGFNTWNAYYPDSGLIVIVLSNVGMRPAGPFPNAADLAHQIAAIYIGDQMLPEEKPVEVMLDPALLQSYAGVYTLEGRQEVVDVTGDTITFRVEDGRLVAYTKMPKIVLCAESESSFYVQQENSNHIAFVRDADGKVTGIVLHLMGVVEMRGNRIGD